jgi:hypothetical protein
MKLCKADSLESLKQPSFIGAILGYFIYFTIHAVRFYVLHLVSFVLVCLFFRLISPVPFFAFVKKLVFHAYVNPVTGHIRCISSSYH